MQPHEFHQHLVGVRGAVKGTGPRPVIGAHLCLHQRGAVHFTRREFLAHLCLFVIGNARGHRPRRQKDRRQMAKDLSRDHQPRHDLVTDAQINRCVEGVVAERHPGGQCDHIARKQAQLHPGGALGHAIAHRGHPARHLGGAACGAGRGADQLGIALKRLMRREHVVIGGDDPDISRRLRRQRLLVRACRRIGMGLSAAGQMRARRAVLRGPCHPSEIISPTRAAAGDDTVRDAGNGLVQHGILHRFVSGPPIAGAPANHVLCMCSSRFVSALLALTDRKVQHLHIIAQTFAPLQPGLRARRYKSFVKPTYL